MEMEKIVFAMKEKEAGQWRRNAAATSWNGRERRLARVSGLA